MADLKHFTAPSLGAPMQRLIAIAQKPEKRIVGLISGTSADGMDAALVRVRGYAHDALSPRERLQLEAFATFPYPPALREQLLAASLPGAGAVDLICRLNIAIGECFAEAALKIIAQAGAKPQDLDLIGSHGQTIHHLPFAEPLAGIPAAGTLQIGEPSVIARRTGIITIADFRAADMALGGQGAPLVPFLDYMVFRSTERTRGVLNIGGIANLTVLKKGGGLEDVVAFDTGPGNMVMDALVQKFFGKTFDDGGMLSAQGKVSEELLAELLQHPYFAKPIPKSTGREEFGAAYCEQLIQRAAHMQLAPCDLLATATALTAETIAGEARRLEKRFGKIHELIVSGGGMHNRTLMARLHERFAPAKVTTTTDYNLPGDAKEAILFAVLANETVGGFGGNVPSVTGAKAATVLGKICL
ncbi:MAG: anhydro-N-acetylmuramic acid kinase [candidate division KSB1 bacterium]|nr:anhydro-N-acetylmuramic acid kinase [candidate division KSB1 bacterium]MDZ7364595.1 anhydro-N-acetylmuramic acid kinase [candidate division KSB1 bacterium]MDZ7402657.1 anhydro-N-acetylmuramic acid kinase [candidate division KSB1 bacterium]